MMIPPRKVIMVGGSFGRDQAEMFRHSSSSIWCVARIYDKVPYANLVFDMHMNGEGWTHRTHQAYRDGKLILQHPEPEFPTAQILPTEDLIDEFGLVFTSSFSWMTAYALQLGVTEIAYYGINMIHDSELGSQRDGLLFLLGYAKAKGVRIETPQRSYLRYGVKL